MLAVVNDIQWVQRGVIKSSNLLQKNINLTKSTIICYSSFSSISEIFWIGHHNAVIGGMSPLLLCHLAVRVIHHSNPTMKGTKFLRFHQKGWSLKLLMSSTWWTEDLLLPIKQLKRLVLAWKPSALGIYCNYQL